jgi:hypothetical protein
MERAQRLHTQSNALTRHQHEATWPSVPSQTRHAPVQALHTANILLALHARNMCAASGCSLHQRRSRRIRRGNLGTCTCYCPHDPIRKCASQLEARAHMTQDSHATVSRQVLHVDNLTRARARGIGGNDQQAGGVRQAPHTFGAPVASPSPPLPVVSPCAPSYHFTFSPLLPEISKARFAQREFAFNLRWFGTNSTCAPDPSALSSIMQELPARMRAVLRPDMHHETLGRTAVRHESGQPSHVLQHACFLQHLRMRARAQAHVPRMLARAQCKSLLSRLAQRKRSTGAAWPGVGLPDPARP